MRKAVISVASGLLFSVLSTVPVLAQSEVTPPEAGGITVNPGTVTPPGGTAFTGSDVQMWMVLAATALVVGVWLVVAARRRARASAG